MIDLDDIPLPRLTGKMLRRVRALSGRQPFRAVLRHQLSRSFGLDDLLALPSEARDAFDETSRPHRGRPPHTWPDAESAPPDPSGHRVSGRNLRDGYREGRISPVEVLEAIAEKLRLEEFGELVHTPFAARDLERAREAASASRRRWQDGEPIGPLDGVPVVVKDHLDVAGMPTGSGTSWLAREEGDADEDSEVARRLREAGALILGKARTTEWGMQPTGFNPNFPMPRNPYDRTRAAGGSSTGTAAAVGLGLAPMGFGSDGGGSIRIPSASCGVFGLKPTYERLSRTGDLWQFGTMSHGGPIGQSTSDLVDFLSVTGWPPDPEDPATAYDPVDGDPTEAWRQALGRGVEDCTIGVWSWAFDEADEVITDSCRQALRELERRGAEIRDVEIEFSSFHRSIGPVVLGVEVVGFLHDTFAEHEEETGDDVRLMMQALREVSGRDFMLARQSRAVLRRRLADAFEDVDLIAAPTTDGVAPSYPLELDHVPVYDEEAMRAMCRFAFLANLTGVPAGTVPVGLVDGLPVGMQFLGDAWDEASVIAAMAECERIGLTGMPRPSEYLALGGQ